MGMARSACGWLLASSIALVGLGGVSDAWARTQDGPPGPAEACGAKQADLRKVRARLLNREVTSDSTPAINNGQRLLEAFEPGGDTAVLSDAYTSCFQEKKGRGAFRLPALVCMGDAALRLADESVDRQRNYTRAYCAYDVAGDAFDLKKAHARIRRVCGWMVDELLERSKRTGRVPLDLAAERYLAGLV